MKITLEDINDLLRKKFEFQRELCCTIPNDELLIIVGEEEYECLAHMTYIGALKEGIEMFKEDYNLNILRSPEPSRFELYYKL